MSGTPSSFRRYAVAVLIVLLAAALKLLLDPIAPQRDTPLLLLFGAVTLSAYYGGFGPGIVASMLSALATHVLFMSSGGSILAPDLGQSVRLVIFVLEGTLISALCAMLEFSRRGAETSKLWAQSNERTLRLSEERYRLLIEGVKDYAILMLDAEGRVASWNAGAERIYGYRADEIEGRHFSIFYLEDDRAMDLPDYELELARRGGRVEASGWRLRKDGTRFWVDSVVTIVRDEEGRPRGFSQVTRDVTERQRAEEERAQLLAREKAARAEAEANERRYRFLAEASAVLASSLDYEDTLATVARLAVPHVADWCAVELLEADGSSRRLALTHRDPARVDLARELEKRHPLPAHAAWGPAHVLRTGQAELHPELPEALLDALAKGPEHLAAFRSLALRSWVCVPMRVRGMTLGAITLAAAESGRSYGPADLACAEDIARRAALAVDNARLYAEAQRANHAKDEFLSILSHELRTPLTSMLGWAQMLRAGNLDEATAARGLELIYSSAKQQTQLVEDLLDISRIITGKLRLDLRPIDLAPTVAAAIDTLHPASEAKRVRLEAVLDPSAGPVLGDPDRLQQVVWNLVSNAIKFTPKRGRVEVRLERFGSHVRIRVSDTGKGIPPAFLPHVFERFRQADPTSTRAYSGLGLGLSIVRHLVELHGGTVEAESAGAGKGATFTVSLPLAPIRFRLAQPPRRPVLVEGVASGDHIALGGLRMLVVDDEPATRELLKAALESCGAEVTTVGSASEALEALDRSTPDVLLSDIGMPGEDGYALIRKVRARRPEHGGAVPAAALTAYAREEDRRKAISAGFQMHMAKPIEPVELTAIVAKLAGRPVRG